MEIFKIIGIGLLTCFVGIVVKQIRPEFYVVVLLSGTIVILFMVVDQLKSIFVYFLTIFNKTNLDYTLFANVLKIVGVGFLIEFANGICVDTNNASVGDKIVLAGKVLIVGLSLPVISNLLNVIVDILP